MPLCIQKLLWNGWFACLFQCKSRDFSFIISRNVSHVDVTVASGMENLSCNNFYTGTRWRSLPTGTLCRRTRVVLFFSLGELCGKGKCASSCGETEAQSSDFFVGFSCFPRQRKRKHLKYLCPTSIDGTTAVCWLQKEFALQRGREMSEELHVQTGYIALPILLPCLRTGLQNQGQVCKHDGCPRTPPFSPSGLTRSIKAMGPSLGKMVSPSYFQNVQDAKFCCCW